MSRIRTARLLTIGKETRSLREWSAITGVKTNTMYRRLKLGYKPEDVIASPKEHASLKHRNRCNHGHVMTPDNRYRDSEGTIRCRQCRRKQRRTYKNTKRLTYEFVSTRAPKFWSMVKRAPGTKCWTWLGKCDSGGYGIFSIGYYAVRAHRVALTLKLGRLVAGMACHKCGNPACCRKAHLYEGSSKTNAEDAIRHGRIARGERRSQAKLTDSDVIKIRSLYQQGGITTRPLAERFSISPTTIFYIIKRVTWRHV